eukprot:symbB.v1.2.030363.t1/scaffold3412.1/size57312/1
MSSMSSFQQPGSKGGDQFPASILRIPQQLISRQQGMRLYRDGAEADVKELLGKAQDSGDANATSSLLLNQAAEKLKLMAKELPALKAAQKDYKSQLCAISVEVDPERLQLLQLVQTQLGHYYASTSEQFFNEVASMDFLYFKGVAERMDAADLEGLATELRAISSLPKVAGEPLPRPLGLASRDHPDKGMSSSSNEQLAASARLQQSILSAGWCPATSSKNEFLEVDLQNGTNGVVITAIALQGRIPATGHWQQTYGLLRLVLEADEALAYAEERTFLRPPVRCVHEVALALCKRALPHWHIADGTKDYNNLTKEAKLDFLSRLIEETSALVQVKTPVVAGLDSDDEDEGLPALQLTAQDILAGRNCAETNRLLQLLACRALGLGETPQWIGRWTLQYQVADENWHWYDGDFEGNTCAEKVHVILLPKPLRARKIRICPVEWHTRPALRLEIFVRDPM